MIQLSHFIAFFLPLIFFSYWFILGYAALTILHTQRCILRNMMLAPSVGLAITIICIFSFSWFGLPIKTFAWILCVSLLLISLGILFYRRILFPWYLWRRYLPFAFILLTALWITGRPLLEFGFAWLSHINDDMLNYSLAASHFSNHAYFDTPSVQSMSNGRDYSMLSWFMYIPGTMRTGSELLLAWASVLTQLSPERIFMPLIIGLNLTVIQAVAGLTYSSRKNTRIAFFSALLYAVSSMANLGVFYQLIAQVDGLALLITCIVFLFRSNIPNYPNALLRYSILSGILLSAFAIFYPELFSLFILSAIMYFGILLLRKKFPAKLFVQLGGITFLITIILLHGYLFNFFTVALSQVDHAAQSITEESALFPYFLIPSGLANLWGIQALAGSMLEPWLSLSILLGLILLIITIFFAAKWLWKEQDPASTATITLFFLCIYFFFTNSDFILFKLSMYAQPFFLSVLSTVIIRYFKKPLISYSAFLILILFNLASTQVYLNRSRGLGYSDIPNASKTDVGSRLDKLFNSTSSIFLSDTPNVVVAKLQSLHGKNHTLLFPSRNFYSNIIRLALYLKNSSNDYRYLYLSKMNPALILVSNNLFTHANATYKSTCFSLFPENVNKKNCNLFNNLYQPAPTSANVLLQSSTEQSIFNRWKKKPFKHHTPFETVPLQNVHNHLIFIDSSLGEHYYLPDDHSKISMYPLENDYFYSDNTFSGIKRYFLFEVLNPSPKPRLVLNITTTLNADQKNQLPHAILIGEKRIPLNLIGNGSARVFSPIISMQNINEQYFFMLDMQQNGKYFLGPPRKGLFSLYGKNIPIDTRKLIGFGRDISIISDSEYQHIKAPNLLSQFPQDLGNPNLEYSGFYEDGWIGKNAYVYLLPESEQTLFQIQGSLLKLETTPSTFSQTLTIWIDNKEILKQPLTQEHFNIKLPLSLSLERHEIKINFSKVFHLPGSDGRPASAKIDHLGFIKSNH